MSPAAPVPAATLILVRDGVHGLEVLMTVRHSAAGFAGGAAVFPGGKVDRADEALVRHCGDVAALPAREIPSRVAAIRETWEESGILLARRIGAEALVTCAELDALRMRRGVQLADLLAEPGLQLAADHLVPFAHWITPIGRPKRFDTLFFIAPFGCDQVAVHDGREAVEARWMRPEEAIAAGDAGALKLVFATRMNLLRLAEASSVADAVAAARRQAIVTVIPELVMTDNGEIFRIPAGAGYGVTDVPAANIPRA